jgi:hypothetical protein
VKNKGKERKRAAREAFYPCRLLHGQAYASCKSPPSWSYVRRNDILSKIPCESAFAIRPFITDAGLFSAWLTQSGAPFPPPAMFFDQRRWTFYCPTYTEWCTFVATWSVFLDHRRWTFCCLIHTEWCSSSFAATCNVLWSQSLDFVLPPCLHRVVHLSRHLQCSLITNAGFFAAWLTQSDAPFPPPVNPESLEVWKADGQHHFQKHAATDHSSLRFSGWI